MKNHLARGAAVIIAFLCMMGIVCVPPNTAYAAATADAPIDFAAIGVMDGGVPTYYIEVEEIYAQAYQSINITFPSSFTISYPDSLKSVWSISHSASEDYVTTTFIVKGTARSADGLKTELESVTFKLADPVRFARERSQITIQASSSKVTTYQDESGYLHYYTFVPSISVNWLEAYNEAKKSFIQDPRYPDDPDRKLQGYLATITCQAEQDKIYNDIATQCGWLGGTRALSRSSGGPILDWDSLPADIGKFGENFITNSGPNYDDAITQYWYWADGPETGKIFYTKARREDPGARTPDPATETLDNIPEGFFGWEYYSFWASQEPNNLHSTPYDGGPGGEYALQFAWSGPNWNDYSHANPLHINGYYIEYGGYPGGPKADELIKLLNPSSAELDKPVYVQYRYAAIEDGAEPDSYTQIDGVGTAWDRVIFEQKDKADKSFTAIRNLPSEAADIPGYTPCGFEFIGDPGDRSSITVNANGDVSGIYSPRIQTIVFLYEPTAPIATPTTPIATPTTPLPSPTPSHPIIPSNPLYPSDPSSNGDRFPAPTSAPGLVPEYSIAQPVPTEQDAPLKIPRTGDSHSRELGIVPAISALGVLYLAIILLKKYIDRRSNS